MYIPAGLIESHPHMKQLETSVEQISLTMLKAILPIFKYVEQQHIVCANPCYM